MNSAATCPSLNALTAGIPCTPKLVGERLVGVDVDLGQIDLAVALGRLRLQRRAELAARAAPFGPEVDDDRNLVGAVDHMLLEGRLVDVSDHARSLDAACTRLAGDPRRSPTRVTGALA